MRCSKNCRTPLGHALRGQRAGLDKTAFQAVDLRGGMAAITVASLAFVDHAPIPERYTADGAGPVAAAALGRRAGRRRHRCSSSSKTPTRRRRSRWSTRSSSSLPAATAPWPKARWPSARQRRARPFGSGATRTCRRAGCRPTRRPATACTATRSRCSRWKRGAAFDGTPGREAVLEAIREHGLASGCLIGTYERPDTSIKATAGEAAMSAMPTGSRPDAPRSAWLRRASIARRRFVEQIGGAVEARVFDGEQAPFHGSAAGRRKAAEPAVRGDDAMAGHDDRERVAAERLADGARAAVGADSRGDGAVGERRGPARCARGRIDAATNGVASALVERHVAQVDAARRRAGAASASTMAAIAGAALLPLARPSSRRDACGAARPAARSGSHTPVRPTAFQASAQSPTAVAKRAKRGRIRHAGDGTAQAKPLARVAGAASRSWQLPQGLRAGVVRTRGAARDNRRDARQPSLSARQRRLSCGIVVAHRGARAAALPRDRPAPLGPAQGRHPRRRDAARGGAARDRRGDRPASSRPTRSVDLGRLAYTAKKDLHLFALSARSASTRASCAARAASSSAARPGAARDGRLRLVRASTASPSCARPAGGAARTALDLDATLVELLDRRATASPPERRPAARSLSARARASRRSRS